MGEISPEDIERLRAFGVEITAELLDGVENMTFDDLCERMTEIDDRVEVYTDLEHCTFSDMGRQMRRLTKEFGITQMRLERIGKERATYQHWMRVVEPIMKDHPDMTLSEAFNILRAAKQPAA